MAKLLELAADILLNTWTQKIQETIINAITSMISFFESSLVAFYDEPLIVDALVFGQWVGRLIFAASLVVLLLDLAEEASSMKCDQFKVIEWPTVLTNLFKAIAFIEIAPKLSVLAMQLGTQLTGQLDPSGYMNGFSFAAGFWETIMPIIALVAVIAFCAITMLRIGAMFVQAFTPFLYVADIVRGQTSAMGDWMRQTIAIAITYFLQHIFFVQGLMSYMNGQYITCLILWLTMGATSRLLSKYGMSSGITGVMSSAGGVARGAAQAIGALGGA